MKFTLSWLQEHLRTQASAFEICQKLNQIGLEVESVEQLGGQLRPFLTAHIDSVRPHPDADRLQICEVNAGPTHQHMQVVCGAKNARAGLDVVFAPVGAVIPQSGTKIKKGKIRGQVSEGMLCSLEELGQAAHSDGIAELPKGTLPGESYADFLNVDDVAIDISITPNRGDALAVRGIARDLSAAGLGELIPWLSQTVEGQFPSPISIKLEDEKACPWFLGRVVKGVDNKPSPLWLQRRLESIGLRPINLLVDLTNYFCFDIGRPFHVFDLSKISGDKLIIRRGRGEKFQALNDKDYQVGAEDCVIADKKGVLSIGGIMGGATSGVQEDTKDIFIECALFDPIAIATTSRRLSLSSDSSVRFERGVDLALPPASLEAITAMILEYAGGKASEVVSAGQCPHWQRKARLHFSALKDVGGINLEPQKASHYLEALGFEIEKQTTHYVDVHVPSWRNDIAQKPVLALREPLDGHELSSLIDHVSKEDAQRDLLEEVLRLNGLDAIEPQLLPPLEGKSVAPLSNKEKDTMALRRLLASLSYVEIIGFSFISQELGQFFGELPKSLTLLNPIAADQAQMRPTPLVNLVSAAQYNDVRGRHDGAFFELGPRFKADGQERVLCGIRYGHTPRYPHNPARAFSWLDAKTDVVRVLDLEGITIDNLQITRDVPSWYHPGRSGAISTFKGDVLAYFGELHPRIVQALDGEGHPAIFEVLIDKFPPKKKRKNVQLSPLQPVLRDFSFLLPDGEDTGTLVKSIAQADRNLITDVQLFDIYHGEHVPKGYRSVSLGVTLQPTKKNLKEKDIEAVSQKIIAKAQKCQATLRQ